MTAPRARPAPEPFERIVTEHGPLVSRVCRSLLPPDAAADAWSETFLSALRAHPRLTPDSNVAGWLVTIAHRRSIDELRRRARRPTPTADPRRDAGRVEERPVRSSPHDDPEAAADGFDPVLARALAALTDRQRLAVVARHVADLPYREVAALLDSSEAAARRAAADGIAHLRRTLDGSRP